MHQISKDSLGVRCRGRLRFKSFYGKACEEEQECMYGVRSEGSDKSKASPDLDLAGLTFNFILFQLTFACCASLRSMVENAEWTWLQQQLP